MAEISGRVIEEITNAPVPEAAVIISDTTDEDFSVSMTTDSDGRCRFHGLPPGRYAVAAQKEGFAPPISPLSRQTFEVVAEQTPVDFTIILRRGALIAGRVLDPRGQPIAAVVVTALLKRFETDSLTTGETSFLAPSLFPLAQSQSNALGEFRLEALCPGQYLLEARAPSEDAVRAASQPPLALLPATYFPGTADVAAAEPVTVHWNEVLDGLVIRAVNVPAYRISGVVVDETDVPVLHAFVTLTEESGSADSLLSQVIKIPNLRPVNSEGRFSFDVTPGVYTLKAARAEDFGFASCEWREFTIDTSGTPRAVSQPVPPEPGAVSVTVENASIPDIRLVVLPELGS
jgi:hypothetical protein